MRKRLGRLQFGWDYRYGNGWGYTEPSCGCRILEFGMFWLTWLDKNCKCVVCKQYECVCEE